MTQYLARVGRTVDEGGLLVVPGCAMGHYHNMLTGAIASFERPPGYMMS
jgi:hypothetical protein